MNATINNDGKGGTLKVQVIYTQGSGKTLTEWFAVNKNIMVVNISQVVSNSTGSLITSIFYFEA